MGPVTLPGETLATGADPTCEDCGVSVVLSVCHSAAGHYVGTYCDCGPHSRESGYYRSRDAADVAFNTGDFFRP